MATVLFCTSLALVLALQIAILRRLDDIPAHAVERIRSQVQSRTRAEADALKEETAKRVADITKKLDQLHKRIQRDRDELAVRYCAEIATLQGRAREREARVPTFTDLVRELREVTSELSKVTSELRALRDDEEQRKTMETTPPVDGSTPAPRAEIPIERAGTRILEVDGSTPAPRAEILPPPLPDELEPGAADFDTRLTVEILPSSTALDENNEDDDDQTVVAARPSTTCTEAQQ
jgi:Skp family chaperone for outer membrane proteins